MLIKNIKLYGYNTEGLQTVYINSTGVVEINPKSLSEDEQTIDAKGKYALMPGLLDVHVHGYGGPDFADADEVNLPIIAEALGKTGLSYCIATLVSLNIQKLKTSLAAIDAYVQIQNKNPKRGLTTILGVHLEGPFIAHDCKGAHDENVLQKKISIEIFKDIISAAPTITNWKITLTPDLEGAIDFIKAAQNLEIDGRKINVKVFIGHTNASEDNIEAAIEAGAIGFTHLGNANMETVTRSKEFNRDDVKSNVVRWVTNENNNHIGFYTELIVDGEHLSDRFVSFIRNSMNDNIILVTDALGPSGLQDGQYMLGSLPILKQGEKFVLADNPSKIAGSAATLGSVIEKYSRIIKEPGMELMESIYLAGVVNPRKTSLDASIKLDDERNFVIFNKNGELVLSACNGRVIEHQALTQEKVAKQETHVRDAGLFSEGLKRKGIVDTSDSKIDVRFQFSGS